MCCIFFQKLKIQTQIIFLGLVSGRSRVFLQEAVWRRGLDLWLRSSVMRLQTVASSQQQVADVAASQVSCRKRSFITFFFTQVSSPLFSSPLFCSVLLLIFYCSQLHDMVISFKVSIVGLLHNQQGSLDFSVSFDAVASEYEWTGGSVP